MTSCSLADVRAHSSLKNQAARSDSNVSVLLFFFTATIKCVLRLGKFSSRREFLSRAEDPLDLFAVVTCLTASIRKF